MNRVYLFLILQLFSGSIAAQILTDSVLTRILKETVITIYPGKNTLQRSPASVSVLTEDQIRQQSGQSMVSAMNTMAGVRMEERSPGSYRLSVRGSLLRSPFGIRNVKVYLDDFPLTDAGGNTYLNLIDVGSISGVEVLKGPEGSVFGSNTGGVVLLKPLNYAMDSTQLSAGISMGSFGLFHEKAQLDKNWKKYRLNVFQSYQRSDGYRENSALQRHYLQAIQQWQYKASATLKMLVFYSDLKYRTPGGITLSDFRENPRSARPPAGPIPGAVRQKAGVYNKTLYYGLSNEIHILKDLRHVFTVFGSHTSFENPFITNYETRDENTYGFRTYLEVSRTDASFWWKWNAGVEWQKTNSRISNYGNNSGDKDTIQSADDVNARQHFYFTRLSGEIGNRLQVELSASLNHYEYQYRNVYPSEISQYTRRPFRKAWMPRVAMSYKIARGLSLRASASKGYSPPTIAEIRPSDQIIRNNLQQESGWNYEAGIRVRADNGRFQADAVVFYFNLTNAIVRRTDTTGNDYFVNAGKTSQPGMEIQSSLHIIRPGKKGFLRMCLLRNSFTWYDFYFEKYELSGTDYSGKRLTGVPPYTVVSSLMLEFPAGLYLFVQHNFTDRIPLNDDNSTYAPWYHLLQAKAGWICKFKNKSSLELFAGADNILNQKYSLGNDLNAIAGRYYNAAPSRNYYAGIAVRF